MTDIKKSILVKGRLKLRVKLLLSAALLASGALGLIGIRQQVVSAATPPDSCFDFDASTGTIVEYYDNQNNDVGQPACPRAVDVPYQIGGVNVLHIGYQSFRLESISAVTFPATLQSIGADAFAYNSINGDVTIPDSVTDLGTGAFRGNNIMSVSLSNSISHIPDNIFNTNRLTSIDIPANISTIGSSAFASNRINGLVLPDNVTTIGQSSFQNNWLETLSLSNAMTNVPNYAFSGNSIDIVDIPSNIQTIGVGAFSNNQTATLNIADGLTSIGQSAFSNHQLTSLFLPDSVNSLGLMAFRYGTLESVRLPSTITTIGTWAFGDNQLTTLNLPPTVQTIQHGAFESNQLTTVYFPDSVTDIGNASFKSNQLESVRLSPNLKHNGIGVETFMNNNLSSVDIPNSITSISNNAFRNNQLTSIVIPPNVTLIGQLTFAENNISTVDFRGDSLVQLGARAFMSNQIREVELPVTTSIIPTSVFSLQSDYGKAGLSMMTSGDHSQAQALIDDVWYVQLQLRNLTNSHNLTNADMLESYSEYLFSIGDVNADGDQTDSLGGHIINPGLVTIRYVDQNDNDLLPSVSLAGDNRYSHKASENASSDMTPYYQVGATYNFVAPAIAGYSGPVPSSPYSHTLDSRDSTVTFVYTRQQPIISNVQVTYSQTATTADITGIDLDAIESLTVGGQSVPEKSDCSIITASCYRIESPELIYLAIDDVLEESVMFEVETAAGESASANLPAEPDSVDDESSAPDTSTDGNSGEEKYESADRIDENQVLADTGFSLYNIATFATVVFATGIAGLNLVKGRKGINL